jgi:hypothetical protein
LAVSDAEARVSEAAVDAVALEVESFMLVSHLQWVRVGRCCSCFGRVDCVFL